MRQQHYFFLSLILLCVSIHSYAAYPEIQQEPIPVVEDFPRWYVGGQLGWGEQQLDSKSAIEPTRIGVGTGQVLNPLTAGNRIKVDADNESVMAGRINIGYRINHYFSLEAGGALWNQADFKLTAYNPAGTFLGDGHGEDEIKTFDILAKLGYVFENHVGIFAKAGAAYVWAETDFSRGMQTFAPILRHGANDERASGVRPEVAVGIAYHFNPYWSVDLNYTYIWGRGSNPFDDDTIPGLQMATFGIQYNFKLP